MASRFLIARMVPWKFFAAGATTAVLGAPLIRPLLTSVTKLGMQVPSVAIDAWQDVRQEANRIRTSASARTESVAGVSPDLHSELQALRDEVRSLRNELIEKRQGTGNG